MTNGNIDNTVRLGDSETLRALIVRTLTDALGIETLCCHKREQDAEMELIRGHAYEDATSGTEAAGPARERVRAVLRLHGEVNAHMGGLTAIAARIAADGLDVRLTDEDVRALAGAMERASEIGRARVQGDLYHEVVTLDREIMDKMPLPDDGLRQLAEELAREDATDHARAPVQDHKVIDIMDWRMHHA